MVKSIILFSRAVAAMPTFTHWVKGKKSRRKSNTTLRTESFILKGGDLEEEQKRYRTVTDT